MRYSAHVSGGTSRSERPSCRCATSADPGTTRTVTLHRRQADNHAGAVTVARARDRGFEAAAGHAASHAVRAEVGEASATDRATGTAAGRTGIESQQEKAPRARIGFRPRRFGSWAKPTSHALPDHLPRQTRRHEPKETVCPQCQGELRKLGEDVSEMLEYVPASFVVIRHLRTKLSCTKCDCIVQAEAPSRPIARGMAGPGLLAHVLVSKYCDHLPLYRQSEMYARRCGTGALDHGRLGGRSEPFAGAAGGSAASLRDGRGQAARRRHAGAGVGSRQWQDQDRAIVDLRSR